MKTRIILILAFALCLISCGKEPQKITRDRTVLVYMAADNNLSSNAYENLAAMVQGAKASAKANVNFIVYFDPADDVPSLIGVNSTGKFTIKKYPEQNSASAQNLSRVINDVITEYPAKKYGLVLWSHATGWINQGSPYLSTAFSLFSAGAPGVKTFGYQVFNGVKNEIELSDLKSAIPGGIFDYIIFDACYMGGVETAYALKDKAEYIISSPTEVLEYGFPYHRVYTDLIAKDVEYQVICEKYYSYYNLMGSISRSASISLIKTSELDALAGIVKEIIGANRSKISAFDISGVQVLDRYRRHFMFDLNDFVSQIAPSEDYLRFKAQFDRVVLYSAHTPWFYNTIDLSKCSGLSSYIPISSYSDLNAVYSNTDWAKACY